ncbi:MAG: hypothetical protein RBT69_07450 [Spirochaetia bacterium]|jgi:hypothetical protein|nr:hypothetical protein [Spirochaetia bacterium]
MDQILNIVSICHTDNEINRIIKKSKELEPLYTIHFSQNEDFFLKTKAPVTIPYFKIHHNFDNPQPDSSYTGKLAGIIEQIMPVIAPVLIDTEYFFDPAELLRPVFFKPYNIEGRDYLYIARLDLSFRPHDCEIIEMGGNDLTHTFTTQNLFLDVNILPVEKIVEKEGGRTDFNIKQSISKTWIGETGRGYFIQGIWMDSELTKFFTKLFLPADFLSYPYYPFVCKYRTISHVPINFSSVSREKNIAILDRSFNFIEPHMREIEEEFRISTFSPEMKLFKNLKKKINSQWYHDFKSLKIRRYINSRGMKEYELKI